MLFICRKLIEYRTRKNGPPEAGASSCYGEARWERAWAGAEGEPGIVTNYLHQAGSRDVPALSEGAKGFRPQRLKNVTFPKFLEKPQLKKTPEQRQWGLSGAWTAGQLASQWAQGRAPSFGHQGSSAHPSPACAELTLVLRLFAFLCQISSPSL